ncbi:MULTISPECIES: glycine cleavage system protein R [Aliivibrio]|jgi:glycine cleavage system transcriptional repressor|uniref:Glycine cleavage system transcriptional repressor n=3 Tax=Aliivibrio TaxID=511678 RepID=A0A1B9NY06_ALILO|nr:MULTISPECIES: glycine cleavage system protein R [Aliivibrio]AZL85547.1 glycine cleavage system protein R [Aliivibrio salmonicida]MBB1313899.1 glycine cleavage system protein R [Aliivibrio sp. SR45-2]OCH20559.1 glycine cleavage system transcriptional repressor [Aliivibrio logei]OEF19963.1 glycine cleavage system transcriptional repressor [Aliivibrio logei 5S-186]CAQ80064.1 glycine cleavage system transcriptional repressor (Gcv operon repressor) [Aliivibrio salmonicida LFI1238]
MSQYLVITAVGTDRPGISNKVTRLVTESSCNIIDSRIASFGNEFTLIMLLSGSANAVSRIENTLPLLGQQHDLITIIKRTSPHQERDTFYTIDAFVESEDRPGLTEKFTDFLANRDIDLKTLSAQTLKKATNQNSFQIQITAEIFQECHIMEIQEEFEHLCSTLNVSGKINFYKN